MYVLKIGVNTKLEGKRASELEFVILLLGLKIESLTLIRPEGGSKMLAEI